MRTKKSPAGYAGRTVSARKSGDSIARCATGYQDWRALSTTQKPLPPYGRRLENARLADRHVSEVFIFAGNGIRDPFKAARHMGDKESRFGLAVPKGADISDFRWPVYGLPVCIWAAGVGLETASRWCDYLMNAGALICRLMLEDSAGNLSMPIVHKRRGRS